MLILKKVVNSIKFPPIPRTHLSTLKNLIKKKAFDGKNFKLNKLQIKSKVAIVKFPEHKIPKKSKKSICIESISSITF